MRAPQVLIVGAGPTGLTAALELARRGIVADLIEQRDAPSALSRAVGILPESIRLLEPSGAAELLRREAIEIQHAIVHWKARPLASIPLNRLPDPRQRMLALPQDRTEELLRQCLHQHGGEVQYGHRLEALEQKEPGGQAVAATINGKSHNYDLVIAADGANSTARECVRIPFEGYELPDQWSIADVQATDWPHPQDACLFVADIGQVVIAIPLETRQTGQTRQTRQTGRYRVISNTEDALATLPVPMQVEQIRRQGTFRISVRQAAAYRRGRVFLAGDAAHSHSPVGGRGMNIGISDAAELARRVAIDELTGYEQARHPIGKQTLVMTEFLRRRVTAKGRLSRTLLASVLWLVGHTPLRNQMIKRLLTSN